MIAPIQPVTLNVDSEIGWRRLRLFNYFRSALALFFLTMVLNSWTEYLVSEQNQQWAKATGKSNFRSLPVVDWFSRTTVKVFLRMQEALFGKKFRKAAFKLKMSSDTIVHVDEALEVVRKLKS